VSGTSEKLSSTPATISWSVRWPSSRFHTTRQAQGLGNRLQPVFSLARVGHDHGRVPAGSPVLALEEGDSSGQECRLAEGLRAVSWLPARVYPKKKSGGNVGAYIGLQLSWLVILWSTPPKTQKWPAPDRRKPLLPAVWYNTHSLPGCAISLVGQSRVGVAAPAWLAFNQLVTIIAATVAAP
jgi:hypothetical protein